MKPGRNRGAPNIDRQTPADETRHGQRKAAPDPEQDDHGGGRPSEGLARSLKATLCAFQVVVVPALFAPALMVFGHHIPKHP